MKELAQLLNEMRSEGIIKDYALFGAVAQMRYTEPVATLAADVLVAVQAQDRLDLLGEIYAFCFARGYTTEGKSILVGVWPTQFIPNFSPLTQEALNQAETVDFEWTSFRVVGASHLAVIALSVGRAKAFTRILALIESGSVTRKEISHLAAKHDLAKEFQRFETKFFSE